MYESFVFSELRPKYDQVLYMGSMRWQNVLNILVVSVFMYLNQCLGVWHLS